MVEWNLDRLFRSATACLALAIALVAGTAFLVNSYRETDNVLGIMLVGAVLVGLGGILGAVWTSAFGITCFCVGAVLADTPDLLLAVVGCVSFAALVIVDLSITMRGAPNVRRTVWTMAAVTVAVIAILAVAFTGLAYLVATGATFAALLLPVGIISVGYAIRVAAEAHERTVPK